MAVRGQVRAGAQRYRALLGLREARWPLVASVAGSMPIGMFGLGILLLVRDANGSFGVAGRVVGAFGVANALGAVTQGRLMDRYGQPAVLRARRRPTCSCSSRSSSRPGRDAPSWVLGLCALGAGACLPRCRPRCARCGAPSSRTRTAARRRTRSSRSSSRSRSSRRRCSSP